MSIRFNILISLCVHIDIFSRVGQYGLPAADEDSQNAYEEKYIPAPPTPADTATPASDRISLETLNFDTIMVLILQTMVV